jgi:hypothetical protein
MSRFYSPERYDSNLVLKVPVHLALVMLYSVRHLFIVFLAFNPMPKLSGAFTFMQPLVSSPLVLLTGIPGLLVLLAWGKREPDAAPLWRRVWANGRLLLTLGLAAHCLLLAALQGADALSVFYYRQSARLVVANLGVDLLLIYYLWRFELIRDVFAEFPEKPVEKENG